MEILALIAETKTLFFNNQQLIQAYLEGQTVLWEQNKIIREKET